MDKQDSGEDRISALPDDIICNILSNLCVEESARTSILSKRWHDMWLLSPITICDESIVKQSCIYCFTQVESSSWIVNAMSHIISIHPGPIPSCHFILPDWHEYHETLVNLLKTLTLKGIQNLQIDFRDFKVPCFVLECDSLVDVLLRACLMPAQLPAHTDIFPNLRKLTLTEFDMDNKLLISLLSSRSIIELALIGCYGVRDLVIESDSLQKFYLKGADKYRDDYFNLTIKDVPNLETFKCDDQLSDSKVVILNAPKLKVLSRIETHMSLLQLGNYQFDFDARGVKISGEVTYMPALRSLDIVVDSYRGLEAKFVPYFLMCFPCLETLEVYFYSFHTHYRNYQRMVSAIAAAAIVDDCDYDDHVHPMSNINCLNHCLKSVRLSGFYGIEAYFDFARLIVANAKVLEKLTIVYGYALEDRWMKAQKRFLLQNSASKMLQIEFLKIEKSRCFIVCDERNWKNDQKKMHL